MKTIGLCLIMKNEAHALLQCLESVRPLVDYALIVDAGSADGTQATVRRFLSNENLSGEIIDELWKDFAHNRSFALAKLRERADIDYALMMDATDRLVFSSGFDVPTFKAALVRDLYHIEIRQGSIRFWRPQLLSNRVEFGYKGVLHEVVAAPRPVSPSEIAPGLHIEVGTGGAIGSSNPQKYRDEAETLERALETETDDFIRARYVFYLAYSWMNCGEKEKALHLFLQHSELGFWNQELCMSLYYAAQMKDALGHPDSDVIGSYLKAYESDPTRAEPLHGMMDYCRRHNKPHQAYLIGKQAIAIPEPVGSLFVASWIYDYGLVEEFSIAAYHSGHYKDCLDALERLLSDGKIPESARSRLLDNSRIAAEKLAGLKQQPSPASAVLN
jgi:hypothetical protein